MVRRPGEHPAADNSGAFQYAMQKPSTARLATRPCRPSNAISLSRRAADYAADRRLKKQGPKLVTVFGIGRVCHIASGSRISPPSFASEGEWKSRPPLGARLHPLTVEQNALTASERTTLVPAYPHHRPRLSGRRPHHRGATAYSARHAVAGLSRAHDLHQSRAWIPSTYMPTVQTVVLFGEIRRRWWQSVIEETVGGRKPTERVRGLAAATE